jgi:heavy-metal-associated domain-containing protein
MLLHALEGRVRVKAHAIKKRPPRALELEDRIRAVKGVCEAQANATTGSVLIHFDREAIDSSEILGHLRSWGYLEKRHRDRRGVGDYLLRGITLSVAEAAFQRLFTALIL